MNYFPFESSENRYGKALFTPVYANVDIQFQFERSDLVKRKLSGDYSKRKGAKARMEIDKDKWKFISLNEKQYGITDSQQQKQKERLKFLLTLFLSLFVCFFFMKKQ